MGGALVGCVLIAMLYLTRVLVVPVQRNLLCSLRFHVRGRRVVARSVLRCASRRVSALCAGHYTEFLICPAVLGIAVFVHQRATGRLSVVSLPIYGVFMAIWATCVSAYCSGYVQVAGVALRWFRHS